MLTEINRHIERGNIKSGPARFYFNIQKNKEVWHSNQRCAERSPVGGEQNRSVSVPLHQERGTMNRPWNKMISKKLNKSKILKMECENNWQTKSHHPPAETRCLGPSGKCAIYQIYSIILLTVGIVIQRSSSSGKLGKLQITVIKWKMLGSKFSKFEEFSR